MEYISTEEFLKQDKEVQEVFRDWWEPSKDDLIQVKLNWTYERDFILKTDGLNIVGCLDSYTKKDVVCPLLTEGQLREFIEDKTGFKIEIVWDGLDYDIYLVEELTGEPTLNGYLNLGENLLQAYWKVACEIAKEDLKYGIKFRS